MPRETGIQAEGRITEILPKSIFRVELPNGHRILAFLSGKMRANPVAMGLGDRVKLDMTPFDLSKGRIVAKEETKL